MIRSHCKVPYRPHSLQWKVVTVLNVAHFAFGWKSQQPCENHYDRERREPSNSAGDLIGMVICDPFQRASGLELGGKMVTLNYLVIWVPCDWFSSPAKKRPHRVASWLQTNRPKPDGKKNNKKTSFRKYIPPGNNGQMKIFLNSLKRFPAKKM